VLPPYKGPAITLYRGDGARNRQRRTYGLSWTSNPDVAEAFAKGLYRNSMGGSVILQADVPAEAIICHVAADADHDRYDEAEYLVDRRRLGRVKVIERLAQREHEPRPSR
jgi:hypothetical protein